MQLETMEQRPALAPRAASQLATTEEILKYLQDGPDSDTKKERGEFLGLSKDDIKEIGVAGLRQLPVDDRSFSLEERGTAEQYAFDIGGYIETELDEHEQASALVVVRWETLEEVKDRVSDKEYKAQVKKDALELMGIHEDTLTYNSFECEFDEREKFTLCYSDDGIHRIEKAPNSPRLAGPTSNLNALSFRFGGYSFIGT